MINILQLVIITLFLDIALTIRLTKCELCNEQDCKLNIKSISKSDIIVFDDYIRKNTQCTCNRDSCGIYCEKSIILIMIK